jgi:hypothetical protein
MQRNYDDYINFKVEGKSTEEVVSLARADYHITTQTPPRDSEVYGKSPWVPFNLERLYVDELIDEKQYQKARDILKRMRCSYFTPDFQNFIEFYEYHLLSVVQSEKAIIESIKEAKREFNQHTTTLVSIIVGIITIFGTANMVYRVQSYVEMFLTFITIVLSIVGVILTVAFLNAQFPKHSSSKDTRIVSWLKSLFSK